MIRTYNRLTNFIASFTIFFLTNVGQTITNANNILKGHHTYDRYYQIQTSTESPFSLLDWLHVEDPYFREPTPYKRVTHFGSWIRDPSGETCLDVRGVVLKREARAPIKMAENNACRIVEASWYDSYEDEYVYLASDIQIDHVVPLKNAYQAGAWSWSQAKRCHYANFLTDSHHLLPVQRHANLSKGDRGPEVYMPINSKFQCQYLAIWLRIKALWDLKIAIVEGDAIQNLIKENQCAIELFVVEPGDFYTTHNTTENPPSECLSMFPNKSQSLLNYFSTLAPEFPILLINR